MGEGGAPADREVTEVTFNRNQRGENQGVDVMVVGPWCVPVRENSKCKGPGAARRPAEAEQRPVGPAAARE